MRPISKSNGYSEADGCGKDLEGRGQINEDQVIQMQGSIKCESVQYLPSD